MATSQNPLTGKMSGTVGNFVTSSLGSQNIVRTKAFSYRDAKTEAQIKQRDGFKMIGELYPALGSIPEEGFVQRPANTSAYNAFMAVNMRDAIDKSGETASINYSMLTVANGTLPVLNGTGATLDASGITVSYSPSLKNLINKPTDEIVALVLLSSNEVWLERKERGSELSDNILIPVTEISAADIKGVYLFAKRADGSKSSKSTYLSVV